MYFRSLHRIKEACVNKKIVLVGYGKIGKELLPYLLELGLNVILVMDNNADNHGKTILGISIDMVRLVTGEDIMYVVSPAEPVRTKLINQLVDMGGNRENILVYYNKKEPEYYKSLSEDDYKEEISDKFRDIFDYDLDWENPRTYNEILNVEKLAKFDDIKTKLADKYLVREWIIEKLGEEYLPQLYGAWDSAAEIPFVSLPSSFVLKTNNGSGRNIIVKEKSSIDEDVVRAQLDTWLAENFYYASFERQYKDIKPMIICEEYLEGVAEAVCEYNIYCFHGVPKYIWCIRGSHRPECKASFYDTDWNKQEFSYGYPYDEYNAPRPQGLDEMLKLSRKLAESFEHVRVDWNNLPDGRILFSEITFSSWSGLNKFKPDKWDLVFGEMILENNK